MPGFTTSFLIPDINVWIALSHARHVHHHVATDWLESMEPTVRLSFCRFTQIGFLRLLTSQAVMGEDVLTQAEAWAHYDRWLKNDNVNLIDEPPGVESRFRALARSRQTSPKSFGDAYIAAFAETSQMTLVTFDRAFGSKVRDVLLLEE